MIRIAVSAITLLVLAQPAAAGQNKKQEQPANPIATFFQSLTQVAQPAEDKGRQTRKRVAAKTTPQIAELPVRQPAEMAAAQLAESPVRAEASQPAPRAVENRFAATDAGGNLGHLVAKHAAVYNVPVSLVRRVIRRESRGNPRAVSKGNYGLMQIRLGTARAMGYRGSAAGLLDADTNMTYAVKYLAGAYRVAGGNQDRAVRLYASGYYYAAKSKGLANPDGTLKNAAAPGLFGIFTQTSAD